MVDHAAQTGVGLGGNWFQCRIVNDAQHLDWIDNAYRAGPIAVVIDNYVTREQQP
jgi:hypothetical protein